MKGAPLQKKKAVAVKPVLVAEAVAVLVQRGLQGQKKKAVAVKPFFSGSGSVKAGAVQGSKVAACGAEPLLR